MVKRVWKAGKYSLGVRGFTREEIAEICADYPVKIVKIKIHHNKKTPGFWIDYAGDARRDWWTGVTAMKEIVRKLCARGAEYYEFNFERGWHKVNIKEEP
jgi:hypothetical protein